MVLTVQKINTVSFYLARPDFAAHLYVKATATRPTLICKAHRGAAHLQTGVGGVENAGFNHELFLVIQSGGVW